jgi:quinolinate synthase
VIAAGFLSVLERIAQGCRDETVQVPDDVGESPRLALDRMLEVSGRTDWA